MQTPDTDLTLSEFYSKNYAAGLIFAFPQPLRTDHLGREIFADGSYLTRNLIHPDTHGIYDISEWFVLECQAFELGRKQRLARKKMSSDFLKASKKHPDRICESYCNGFFSVPDWPKRQHCAA